MNFEADDYIASPVQCVVNKAKQFDFGRRWKHDISPLLCDCDVECCLTLGLKLFDPSFENGSPPWLVGRGPLNGQKAKEGCLSWYQPWGRCHYIAPFSWALGMRLYPSLKWGFLSGKFHTVVIGYEECPNEYEWVLDILQFKERTADDSVSFVKSTEWTMHQSLPDYIASFCPSTSMKQEIRNSEYLKSLCFSDPKT